MSDKKDIIIIGGGPAGLSAALTAINRGRDVLIIGRGSKDSGLSRAPEINNYPGIAGISGLELQERMENHAASAGAVFHDAQAVSIVSVSGGFYVSAGADFFECSAVVLAVGITQKQLYPGEQEFLGAGVSYCATCDGMLYRNKRVAVIGQSAEALHETEFLKSIGCDVLFFTNKTTDLDSSIPVFYGKKYEIFGDDKVRRITADDASFDVDGVFILRSSIAMTSMLPELELSGGHISVDRSMKTNIDGVFAAGDCTGLPYQIAKAVGEGNIAGLSAAEWVQAHNR